MKSLSIILPCYNPIQNWQLNVVENYNVLIEKLPKALSIEIILVNDGAQKGIEGQHIDYLKASIPNFIYINYPQNKGKGFAVRKGVAAANSDCYIYTDIDFPYTNASFLALFDQLAAGETDICIPIRDQDYYKDVPLLRKWISKCLKLLIKTFLRIKVSDTQGGLKGFNKKGKKIFLSSSINRYLFDLEFIYMASRRKDISLQTVPVQLRENIKFSSVSFRILAAECWSFFKLLFKRLPKHDER